MTRIATTPRHMQMPRTLRREVMIDINMRTMRCAPVFLGCDKAMVALVCSLLSRAHFLKDEVSARLPTSPTATKASTEERRACAATKFGAFEQSEHVEGLRRDPRPRASLTRDSRRSCPVAGAADHEAGRRDA